MIDSQQVDLEPDVPSEDVATPSVHSNRTSFLLLSFDASLLDDTLIDSVAVCTKLVIERPTVIETRQPRIQNLYIK